MATKKTNIKSAKPKTRTSSKATQNTNFFKWWMALLLVAVVAVVGIVVLRFSNASSYATGSEIYVYCGQGICARPGSYYGNLFSQAGSELSRVTVFPESGCDSGYVYGAANLSKDQIRLKAWNTGSLLCLNSGRRPSN